jgi:TonB family protein
VGFTLDSDGEVEHIHVVESSPPDIFDQAALAGMSRCRYRAIAADGTEMQGHELRVVVNFDPTFE